MTPDRFSARTSREQPGTWDLCGTIDEHADLSFFDSLVGPSRLNMRRVPRINSYGVRSWLEGIRRVPGGATYEFVECSPAMIDQANLVAGFLGRGSVASFIVAFRCDRCGYEHDELFFTDDFARGGHLPGVSCPRCATALDLDKAESHYLPFARGR
jgi:hypothetical protein